MRTKLSKARGWVPAVVGLVMTVGVAAACSSSSDAATDVTTTSEAPEQTSTTTEAPRAGSAAEVIAAMQTIDPALPITDVTVYDDQTDPNGLLGRPGQYVGKASFVDPRSGEFADGVDAGGDVEFFESEADLESRATYLEGFATNPGALGGWYQWTEGLALLRVSFDLTPSEADAYHAAFVAVAR